MDNLRSYDVASDGRFIMIPQAGDSTAGGPPATDIVVVQNWIEELKRITPAK